MIAYDAWQSVETGGATLVVRTTLQLDGDRTGSGTVREPVRNSGNTTSRRTSTPCLHPTASVPW